MAAGSSARPLIPAAAPQRGLVDPQRDPDEACHEKPCRQTNTFSIVGQPSACRSVQRPGQHHGGHELIWRTANWICGISVVVLMASLINDARK